MDLTGCQCAARPSELIESFKAIFRPAVVEFFADGKPEAD